MGSRNRKINTSFSQQFVAISKDIGVIVLLLSFLFLMQQFLVRKPPVPSDGEWYTVVKVIDGDTIDVEKDGLKERIRLVGIDTPESVSPFEPIECYGVEASEYTKSLVLGKKVQLLVDQKQGDEDQYARKLRYVFLEDQSHVNYQLVEQGFAHAYKKVSSDYTTLFLQAEKEARNAQRGGWGVCVDF